jgi:MFS family permease
MFTVVSLVVAPALCALADKLQRHKAMLVACILLWAASTGLVLLPARFAVLAAIMLVMCMAHSSIASIVDTAVLNSLKDSSSYGAQRVWGAVGFGLATLTAGTVVDSPLGWRGVFVLFMFCASNTVRLVLQFPIHSSSSSSTNSTSSTSNDTSSSGDCDSSESKQQKPHVREAIAALLGTPDKVLICATVVLSGVASGIIDTFLFVRLYDLGGRGKIMGLARFVMCACEVCSGIVPISGSNCSALSCSTGSRACCFSS